MALSRIVTEGDGSTTQFAVNFAMDYLLKADVTCRVGTETDGSGNPLYRDITFVSTNLIAVGGAVVPAGVKIVFERTVEKNALRVEYNNGDVMDEVNLDISQKQVFMALHEVLDGRISQQVDLDANGHRIINLADPVDAQDAVTKAWATTAANASLAQATAAKDAAVAARVQADADALSTATDRTAVAADLLTVTATAETVASDKAVVQSERAAADTTAATVAAAATQVATDKDAAAASSTSASGSKDAALAALLALTKRFLGAKAADPATDNEGDTLLSGAMYWNTANDEMRAWNGTIWEVTYNPSTSAVTQVFGRAGVITAQAGDYSSDKISHSGTGTGITATTVKGAIAELDTAKAAASHTHAISEITNLVTTLAAKAAKSSTVFDLVNDFGADRTGGTAVDSAANDAIAWLNAGFGRTLTVPAGLYKVDNELTALSADAYPTIRGETQNHSVFSTTSATKRILKITGGNGSCFFLSKLGFTSSVTRTAEFYVSTQNPALGFIEDVRFNKCYGGLDWRTQGGVIRNVGFNENQSSAIAAAEYLRITNSEFGTILDNVYTGTVDADKQPTFGINIVTCGYVAMINTNIMRAGNALNITPDGTGIGGCYAIFLVNSCLDNSVTGMCIRPTGTGQVHRVLVNNCGLQSMAYRGIHIENAGTGKVSGIRVNNNLIALNGDSGVGIYNAGACDVAITNNTIGGNAVDGVAVDAATDFSITGNSIGSFANYGVNGGWGVNIASSADRYLVTGNRTRGNTAGHIRDNGGGSETFINNNLPNAVVAGDTKGTVFIPVKTIDQNWSIDTSPVNVTVSNGSTFTLQAGSGLLVINNLSNGKIALVLAGNGMNIVSQTGTEFVIGSSPGGGQIGLYSNSGSVELKNNTGGSVVLAFAGVRTRVNY